MIVEEERPRAVGTLRKLGQGLLAATIMLLLVEVGLRLVWKITGPPASDTTVVRNRFAADKPAELPTWFWNSMAPGLRANVVGNAMAYPDAELIFRVRPNPSRNPIYGFAGINALGFRTAHLDGNPRASEGQRPLRILHLGDSCAFGWGIRRFDQTMAPQIENRLAADNIRAEVINLAQPGFSTSQGRRLFDEWFAKLEPDFVILQYGWNDRRNSRGFTDRQVMRFLPILSSRPVKLLMKSALYRTFAWAARSPTPTPPNPAFGDRDLDPVIDNDHMRVPLWESVANYRSMIARSRAAGAKVLIILPPHLPSVPGLGLRMRDFNGEIAAAFQGEATYLALPAMREPSTDLRSYFDPDGIHPSLRGVRYIAEELADEIARQVHGNGAAAGATAASGAASAIQP